MFDQGERFPAAGLLLYAGPLLSALGNLDEYPNCLGYSLVLNWRPQHSPSTEWLVIHELVTGEVVGALDVPPGMTLAQMMAMPGWFEHQPAWNRPEVTMEIGGRTASLQIASQLAGHLAGPPPWAQPGE
jgi:hypothetical protein